MEEPLTLTPREVLASRTHHHAQAFTADRIHRKAHAC